MRGSGKSYRVNWQSRVRPGSAEAYAFATMCVVIASLARWGLGLLSEGILVFALYYPVVLFAALIGGAGAGTFACNIGRRNRLVGIHASTFCVLPDHCTTNRLTNLFFSLLWR